MLAANIPRTRMATSAAPSLAMPDHDRRPERRAVEQSTKIADTGCKSAPRALTRAQKLAKALKACERKRNKLKRATCVARVKRDMGRGRKGKASRKPKGAPIMSKPISAHCPHGISARLTFYMSASPRSFSCS